MGRGRNSQAAVATTGFDSLFGTGRGRAEVDYSQVDLPGWGERDGVWDGEPGLSKAVDGADALSLRFDYPVKRAPGELASARLRVALQGESLSVELENGIASAPVGTQMSSLSGKVSSAELTALLTAALAPGAGGTIGESPLALTRADWTGSKDGRVLVSVHRDGVKLELAASRGRPQEMTLSKRAVWALVGRLTDHG